MSLESAHAIIYGITAEGVERIRRCTKGGIGRIGDTSGIGTEMLPGKK